MACDLAGACAEATVSFTIDKTPPEISVIGVAEGARTGQIGDGKIFVTDLLECIRIRTGERGSAAIG